MTGIKRLRAIAGAWDEWGLGGALTEIADEIERERDADVADSPYDAILPEDREAIAWVRERGGLEAVEARLMPEGYEWPRYDSGELVGFGDDVSRHGDDFEANIIALYRDGSFSLNFWAYSKGERVKRVKRPAAPAADGEPLEVGQTVWDTDAETDTPLTVVEVSSDLVRCEYTWKDGKTYRPCYPPSVLTHQRPVLDAEGNRIEPAMDVWWVCEGDESGVHAERLRVETICPNGLIECSPYNGGTWVRLEPSELYVNKPVPASDGRPLREGETVWHVKTGREYVVVEPSYGKTVVVRLAKYDDAEGEQYAPDKLTHTKPEPPDSWERIEEDATLGVNSYRERYGIKKHDGMTLPQLVREDLVRRCKALAERERSK